MTKQGLVSWRCLHQPCWQAIFSPAFWLGTPSGLLFPPGVGRVTSDAMISNDLNEKPSQRLFSCARRQVAKASAAWSRSGFNQIGNS